MKPLNSPLPNSNPPRPTPIRPPMRPAMKGEREKKPPAGLGWPMGGRAVCWATAPLRPGSVMVRSNCRVWPGAVLVLGGAE